MIVKWIKITGHPGIGDVDLNFMDESGHAFNTVVIAGGNGTGKSSILETLYDTMSLQPGANIGPITAGISFSPRDEPTLRRIFENAGSSGDAVPNCSEFELSWSKDVSIWEAVHLSYLASDGVRTSIQANIGSDDWKTLGGAFYSEASVSFNAPIPQSVTSRSIDNPTIRSARSGDDLAASIAQLIVDIRSADNEDLANWVRLNPDEVPPASVKDIRFKRFENAFDFMFPSKRFKHIQQHNGLIIKFEENGRESSLSQLSTGEKQIVFRAGFLLANLSTAQHSVILIDEPELSLHPEWQSRIVGFYETILRSQDASPQIFIATHSPFIVHGSIGAKTVILEKDNNTGIISQMPEPKYPMFKAQEAVQAFNIDTFLSDQKKPMLILVEGRTDVEIITNAWRKLRPNKARPFEARDLLGSKNINQLLREGSFLNKIIDQPVYAIFDFDDAYNQWNGLWPREPILRSLQEGMVRRHPTKLAYAGILPVPAFRSDLASLQIAGNSALSIEMMFEDKFHLPNMVSHIPLIKGQTRPVVDKSKKVAFAQASANFESLAFAHFEPLLVNIEKILNNSMKEEFI